MQKMPRNRRPASSVLHEQSRACYILLPCCPDLITQHPAGRPEGGELSRFTWLGCAQINCGDTYTVMP